MLKEIEAVCKIWKKDIKNYVEYRSRELNFEKIPLIGAILKAMNMQEITVKDPVIFREIKKNSYLLFLNDLLRKPN